MLDVLRAQNLRQTAVVVTRYFGGIKLGAGGLVRAYSGSVAENLSAAKRVCYQMCVQSKYIVSYPLVDTILRFFGENDCNVLSTDYLNEVTFTVAIKKENEQAFNLAIINRLNGNVVIQKDKEYFYPFVL
jgi:putative IMPACT (imprinted ancient) family translation regulator